MMSCFSRDKGALETPPLQQPESASVSQPITADLCLTHLKRRTNRIEYKKRAQHIILQSDVNIDAIEVCPEDFPEPTPDGASQPDVKPQPDKDSGDYGLNTPCKPCTPQPELTSAETAQRSRWARFLICVSARPKSPNGSPYRRRDTSLKTRESKHKRSDSVRKLRKKRRALSCEPPASTSKEDAVFRMDQHSEQCMEGAVNRWLRFNHEEREREQLLGEQDYEEDMVFMQEYLGIPHSNYNYVPIRRPARAVSERTRRLMDTADKMAFNPCTRSRVEMTPALIRVQEACPQAAQSHAAVQAVAETKLQEAQTVSNFTQLDNLKEVLENLPMRGSIRRKTNKKVDIVHFTQLYSPPPEFADEGPTRADTKDRYHITFQEPEPNYDPYDYNDSNFTYTIYGDIDEGNETDDTDKGPESPKAERRREYLI